MEKMDGLRSVRLKLIAKKIEAREKKKKKRRPTLGWGEKWVHLEKKGGPMLGGGGAW